MIIPECKFQGYRLKSAILNNQNFNEEDKILYKVFSNSLKKFPDDIDENLFYEYLEHLSDDLIDIICYYIIVSRLGNQIFDKDKYFISELCTALTIKNVFPLKYAEYTSFFLSEPIYSLIMKINEVSYQYGYLSIFDKIIKDFDLSNIDERTRNEIIKSLHKILEEKYYILLKDCSTLESIYIKLHQAMLDANKKGYAFNKADFDTLNSLKDYITNNDKELIAQLKKQLLASEDNAFDNLSIIRNCLKIISEYTTRIIPLTLSRRKAYEKK